MFRLPGIDRWRTVLLLCLLLAGLQQLAGAGLIQAKAWLAPVLIEKAWEQSIALGGAPVKPWPWADTWPVARLRVAARDIDLLVLAGDSGNALAFGPGHALASAPLGSPGLAVIGGHRDTHFNFLQHLQAGALVQLQLPTGAGLDYRVEAAQVVDAGKQALPLQFDREELLLVTCYPFDTLRPGGPLRYVIRAVPRRSNVPRNQAPRAAQQIYAM